MKLWTLIENTSCREDLQAEHGLSLYLEVCGKKILFDAGQSIAFADNAEKLGIDLTAVDLAVLSHGHYDHSGGLKRFLELNDHAPLYLSQYAFEGHYNVADAYIGVDQTLRESGRLVFCGDLTELAPGLTLYSCNDRTCSVPLDHAGLQMDGPEGLLPDDFRHEQYLLIEENGKRILISGCSHKGILNIVRWFRPDVLIGGFHFMKMDPEDPRLETAAQMLLEAPTAYYTGHCTGEGQFAKLKEWMGERLHYIASGSVIEL